MKDIEIDKFSDTFQNIVVKRRKELNEIFYNEEMNYLQDIVDILCSYEPNEELRKEQIEYYFDEKRVREKITQIYIQLTKT